MKITFNGSGYTAEIRHENGTSFISGADFQGVLMAGIENAYQFEEPIDVPEPEDFSPEVY